MISEAKSDVRRMRPDEVAQMVKVLRDHLGWKQQVLADAARVDLRTVQRVESGERPVGDLTLRAIAKALNLDSETFIRVEERKSEEQMLKELEEWQGNNQVLQLQPITSGHDLMAFIETIDAWNFQHEEVSAEDEQAAVGSLLDYVRDMLDIHSDLYPSQRIESANEMSGHLATLGSFGLKAYVASRAQNRDKVRMPPLTIGYLLLSKDEKIAIVVPKDVEVRFK